MGVKDDLVKIVGKKNVLDSPDILEVYAGEANCQPRIRPKLVVKPANAQEVQQVVKWANEMRTPLVAVSSGAPHTREDTIPGMGGAVIVDLTRMKKIMRIDPNNRVAWVEPGVTFTELQPELEKAGFSAHLPLCPRSNKSVLASMLEREPITMPAHHWDCLDPFLCGEIIFGTGDILRSGEAAGPDPIEEQWKKGKAHMSPFGLGQFDESRLVTGAQGTIGIITWASLKIRPLSTTNKTFLVPSDNLEPLIDASYTMLRRRFGDHSFILNDLNLACLLAQDRMEINALREALPKWILVTSLEGYGLLPEEKVAYQEADFKEILARSSGLKPETSVLWATGDDLSQILSRPSAEPYWKIRHKGAFRDLFFLTTLDETPRFAEKISSLAVSQRFSPSDIGVYIQPIVQGTSCHCEFDFYYDPDNEGGAGRAKWLATEGAAELSKRGAFFSRPYGPWAKIAYAGAAETAIVQRKVKNIFDPQNVLNPGKLCF
ncbi:MAG: putative FAD-linked oxidoreductase [Syntrophorhabdus sp. PtaU1.Bin050]|nr:MAG: putative FAD-linked oxidoreductase [Syntrophorhabdus sp. PtaU1.Bin050]